MNTRHLKTKIRSNSTKQIINQSPLAYQRNTIEVSLNNPLRRQFITNGFKSKDEDRSYVVNRHIHIEEQQNNTREIKLIKSKQLNTRSKRDIDARSKKQIDRQQKKEIQATLNDLHRLQAEIYQLNVPQNPHGSGPVKKQLKQLSYLYQNMTKPKHKNNLNIQMADIENAVKVINNLHNRNSAQKVLPQHMGHQLHSDSLKKVMGSMYGQQFDLSLLSDDELTSSDKIYEFLNYSEYDSFDPIKEAYEMFLDEENKFSLTKYKEISAILEMPQIINEAAFKKSLAIESFDSLTYQKFVELIHLQKH